MENYIKVTELAKNLLEADSKLQEKYTKAESKRIRTILGEIKKTVTSARADLVQRDKQ